MDREKKAPTTKRMEQCSRPRLCSLWRCRWTENSRNSTTATLISIQSLIIISQMYICRYVLKNHDNIEIKMEGYQRRKRHANPCGIGQKRKLTPFTWLEPWPCQFYSAFSIFDNCCWKYGEKPHLADVTQCDEAKRSFAAPLFYFWFPNLYFHPFGFYCLFHDVVATATLRHKMSRIIMLFMNKYNFMNVSVCVASSAKFICQCAWCMYIVLYFAV